MRLIGVHTGSCAVHELPNAEKHAFAREFLIGHHLRLIAVDYPDLREQIDDRWPAVTTFKVSGV